MEREPGLEQLIAATALEEVALALPAAAGQVQTRLHRLEQELIAAKRAKRALEVELVELRSHLQEADLKLGASVSGYYRLGRILVEAASTWRGLLQLVPRLFILARDEWRARPKTARKETVSGFGQTAARDGSMIAQVHLRSRATGYEAASSWVLGLGKISPQLRSRLLMEVAKLWRHEDAAAAIELARKAIDIDKTDGNLQWLAFALYDAGFVFEPAQLLRELRKAKTPMIGVQAGLADRVLAREELLTSKVAALPDIAAPQWRGGEGVILLADHILPLRWSLSACRIHAVALMLQAQGCEVIVACPSRPASAQPRDGHVYGTDGVRYAVMENREERQMLRWLNGGLDIALAQAFAELNIRAVFASSRLSILLPAMELARHQGCYFVIDDEGDEPVTAVGGTNPASTEFLQLARQLREDVRIAANRVTSPWRLTPIPHDGEANGAELREHSILHGRRVIGFVGEQAPEYNLGMLPMVFQQAAETIGKRGKLALLMAGIGRALDLVEDQLIEKGWDHDVLVLQRPAPTELAEIYAAMDVFAAPTVENLSALDRAPVEIIMAIRAGVPVVASDCAASQRWKAAGLPIIISDRADGMSLGNALARLLLNPSVMAEARRQAAAWNAAHVATRLDEAA